MSARRIPSNAKSERRTRDVARRAKESARVDWMRDDASPKRQTRRAKRQA